MTLRTLRKYIFAWQDWRLTQRLYRAKPILRDIDRRAAAARRGHKRVAEIVAERRQVIHAELERGVGRAG